MSAHEGSELTVRRKLNEVELLALSWLGDVRWEVRVLPVSCLLTEETMSAHQESVQVGTPPDGQAISHHPAVIAVSLVFVAQPFVFDRGAELFVEPKSETLLIAFGGIEVAARTAFSREGIKTHSL